MNIAITFYKDIPLPKEEYARRLGLAIIDGFELDEVTSITIIPFDRPDFAKWKGEKEDTPDLRAAWAAYKLAGMNGRGSYSKKLLNCKVCGVGFEGKSNAKYCSNACRQKAKVQRSKAI